METRIRALRNNQNYNMDLQDVRNSISLLSRTASIPNIHSNPNPFEPLSQQDDLFDLKKPLVSTRDHLNLINGRNLDLKNTLLSQIEKNQTSKNKFFDLDQTDLNPKLTDRQPMK